MVTKMGGKVMIIPHKKMPTKRGCWSVSLLKIIAFIIIIDLIK
jgi:hypothetical protein